MVFTPQFMPSIKKALPPSLYIEDFIEDDETENEELVDLELKAMVLRLRNIPITSLATTLFNLQTDLRSIKGGQRLSQRHLTYHKKCPQRDQVGLGFLGHFKVANKLEGKVRLN